MTGIPRWNEQFDRVHRYQVRIEELAKGRPFDRPAAWFLDDIFAFFVECHSLKDWFANDPLFLPGKTEKRKHATLNRFINCNEVLQVCADIANGKKHFTLTSCKKHPERLGWTDGKPQLYHYIEVSIRDNREEPLCLRPLQYTSDVIGRFKKETGRDMSESDFETLCYERELSNLQEADRICANWKDKRIVEDYREIEICICADIRHKTQQQKMERTMTYESGSDTGVAALACECIDAWKAFLRQQGELT